MKIRNKVTVRARELFMIARGLARTGHPILAHIVPMRRCNLSCTYCNEFDDFSPPVPLEEMIRRVDRLAYLGTAIVTISGGEPTLHPQLDEIIARIRRHGMIAGLITNGYLLTPERIRKLNAAGLHHLQISIDNLNPDEVSKKSLKVLDQKLQNLAEHAEFFVNINSVIGSGIQNPEDAIRVAERAVELGFSTTLGIIHDGTGKLVPLGAREMSVYDRLRQHGKKSYARFIGFREDLAHGRPHNWRCRSGGRYLYICEDGLVHLCSQQRGYPGVSLLDYTHDDLRREFDRPKTCARYCTIACVQIVGLFDNWRSPQKGDPYVSRRARDEAQPAHAMTAAAPEHTRVST
jgi:MoaA/NifB/PqqE/SkfB family radical SAM enzyme